MRISNRVINDLPDLVLNNELIKRDLTSTKTSIGKSSRKPSKKLKEVKHKLLKKVEKQLGRERTEKVYKALFERYILTIVMSCGMLNPTAIYPNCSDFKESRAVSFALSIHNAHHGQFTQKYSEKMTFRTNKYDYKFLSERL